jgi:hypothetical protein
MFLRIEVRSTYCRLMRCRRSKDVSDCGADERTEVAEYRRTAEIKRGQKNM